MKVDIDLTTLFAESSNWNKICDAFKIPEGKRSESWVAEAVLERVRTYLTGYLQRRSVVEQENGAALTPPTPFPIEDPEFDKQT